MLPLMLLLGAAASQVSPPTPPPPAVTARAVPRPHPASHVERVPCPPLPSEGNPACRLL